MVISKHTEEEATCRLLFRHRVKHLSFPAECMATELTLSFLI